MTLPTHVVNILRKRPIGFTVLIVFVLDRSLSMAKPKTYDHRVKWIHLVELVERLLKRFEKSRIAPAFRVGFVWFSDDAYIVSAGGKRYFKVVDGNPALEAFSESTVNNRPYGMTSIADALEAARDIIKDYINDDMLPDEKYVTVFLFTDGRETKRDPSDVASAAERLSVATAEELRALNPRNRLSIASIAMGLDADRETLRDIASYLREVQRKVLEERGLLEIVDPPYHEKMFIEAPRDGRLTREWEEAVRRFVERLSETAAL